MGNVLNIGIAHTKLGIPSAAVYKAWETGLARHGDKFTHIYSLQDLQRQHFDAVICVSYPQFDNVNEILIEEHTHLENRPPNFPSPLSEFRREVVKYANANGIRLIFIDTGILKCSRVRDGNLLDYYQVGYDCIKGLGEYYNEGMPSDRFDKLDIEIKDWRTPNNHILMFGQLRFGIGSQQVDIYGWYRHCLRYLKDNNFRTYYIEHPNVGEPFRHEKFKMVTIHKRECKYSNDIGVSLTFSTNAAIDSIVNGVPTICYSRLSPAYKVCSNNLEDLRTPKIFERKQFLSDLAFSQWQTAEMADGSCWAHLRPYAKEPAKSRYPKIKEKKVASAE